MFTFGTAELVAVVIVPGYLDRTCASSDMQGQVPVVRSIEAVALLADPTSKRKKEMAQVKLEKKCPT